MSQDRHHQEYRQVDRAGRVVDRHDDDYVEMRESLIPSAELHAAAVEKAVHERLLARGGALTRVERREWDTVRDSAFHMEMERLVRGAVKRGAA